MCHCPYTYAFLNLKIKFKKSVPLTSSTVRGMQMRYSLINIVISCRHTLRAQSHQTFRDDDGASKTKRTVQSATASCFFTVSSHPPASVKLFSAVDLSTVFVSDASITHSNEQTASESSDERRTLLQCINLVRTPELRPFGVVRGNR